MQVPYARESCPEALASRKVVNREVGTEGSETAKPGTEVHEHEPDKRHSKPGEVAHHANVQTLKSECFVSRFGSY